MDLKVEPGASQSVGLPVRITGICPGRQVAFLRSSLSQEPVPLELTRAARDLCALELVHYRAETVEVSWGQKSISIEFTELKPLSFTAEFGLFLLGAVPIVLGFLVSLVWKKRKAQK